jgi:hypothetical protein
VAFLKFSLDTGKQRSHAGGDDGARWLDDDGYIFAAFEDKPEKVVHAVFASIGCCGLIIF